MITIVMIAGALCVWRNPDRDIREIFKGDSYQTVYFELSAQDQTEIEKKIGQTLDPDETEFKFYPVLRKGQVIGTVSTHLSKGQYGAIEVVVAIESGPGRKPAAIKTVRIQRDREKARAALRSEKFLGQFVNKTAADSMKVGFDIRTAAPGAEKSSAAIALAVKKLMLVFEKMTSRP